MQKPLCSHKHYDGKKKAIFMERTCLIKEHDVKGLLHFCMSHSKALAIGLSRLINVNYTIEPVLPYSGGLDFFFF